MNTKEWAERLNGREYGKEITWKEEMQAKDDGIVIVSGSSDDIMVFSGAISDELDAYNGATAYITPSGILEGCSKDPRAERCKYLFAAKKGAVQIKAHWSPDSLDASWLIEPPATLPHETFDIMEDGELYCRGIVFRLEDLKYPEDEKTKALREVASLKYVVNNPSAWERFDQSMSDRIEAAVKLAEEALKL